MAEHSGHLVLKYNGDDVSQTSDNYAKLFMAKFNYQPPYQSAPESSVAVITYQEGDRESRLVGARQGVGCAGPAGLHLVLWQTELSSTCVASHS